MKIDEAGAIEGVTVSPLKKVEHPKGDVLHAMKASGTGYTGFGEAYFSTIHQDEVKGWKKHLEMTLNLIVPVGEILFVICDDRESSQTKGRVFQITLSQDNYCRLTISPGLWLGFQGRSEGLNLLLNVADIEHDPDESINIALDEIDFTWSSNE